MVGNGRHQIRRAALVALALAAASCSGSTTPTTTVATTTTTPPTTTTVTTTTVPPTTVTTTTTEPPTTTTVDPLARPDKLVSNFDRDSVDDFDTTGDDLYRIALELDDLFNYFEGNPTGMGEDMVGMIFDPSYPFFTDLARAFEELSANEWRYADAGMETTAIEILKHDGDMATVRSTSQRGEQVVVDSSGAEVRRDNGWSLDIATYRLIRGDDLRWRYLDVGAFETPTTEEIHGMVPVEWIGRKP